MSARGSITNATVVEVFFRVMTASICVCPVLVRKYAQLNSEVEIVHLSADQGQYEARYSRAPMRICTLFSCSQNDTPV